MQLILRGAPVSISMFPECHFTNTEYNISGVYVGNEQG